MPRTTPGDTRLRVLDFVRRRVLAGAPPSVREVQDAFGFRSTATAREHLAALVAAGQLEQEPGRDRGFRVPGAAPPALAPILGRIRAGTPDVAVEDAAGFVPVAATSRDGAFALRVVGESMAGRGIHDGDLVIAERDAPVRSGDVVVAVVDDEATLKTLVRAGGRVVLKAENPEYADIVPPSGANLHILGRVVELRRRV
ncbi:MAG: transcriptional repressor LexA [Gammaproteobacteria bacterium]